MHRHFKDLIVDCANHLFKLVLRDAIFPTTCVTKLEKPLRVKATFHLTISMRGERATYKIQRNNYHHGSCGPSLTGKTMSVFLIFTQGTYRNVKNR